MEALVRVVWPVTLTAEAEALTKEMVAHEQTKVVSRARVDRIDGLERIVEGVRRWFSESRPMSELIGILSRATKIDEEGEGEGK